VPRAGLAISLTLVATLCGCALGINRPASQITANSATLEGEALSTIGGEGSYFVEYGATSGDSTQATPTRGTSFVVGQPDQVSEPVDGLEQGRGYRYRVCAEDSQNRGYPVCSPFQDFVTAGDSVQGVVEVDRLEFAPDLTYGYRFDIDSGPSGENLSGSAVVHSYSGRSAFGTPVSLRVQGNRAYITIVWDGSGLPACVEDLIVEDGGPGGTDKVLASDGGSRSNCSQVGDVIEGDVVVVDGQPPQ
jgi:hypothetical protein